MIMRTREPDIDGFLRVLQGEKDDKPHLFELFMDRPVYEYFAQRTLENESALSVLKLSVDGFYNAGFDYASTYGCALRFETASHDHQKSYSANEGGVITDWESFHAYPWPDASSFDYSHLADIAPYLPRGMKLGILGPGGVLENVTALIGFEAMCIMRYEEPELLEAVFNKVGQIILEYYTYSVSYDTVAFLISNDDWGFNTQTFLSVSDMRRFVFPWHKKFVELAHSHNKPIVLHSCGYMLDVFDDIIDDMHYDAKHSYEDNILSVEESYRRFGHRITILGGLDLNFLITSDCADIKARCEALLALTKENGRYMLGSGNSLAYYVPTDKIETMLAVATQAQ